MDADTADRDRLLMGSHAPYYAPAVVRVAGRRGAQALPAEAGLHIMEKMSLAVRLGEFVAALRFEDLLPAVVDKGKVFVNHAVTVGLAGSQVERSQVARCAVLENERLGVRCVGAGQGATL